MLVFLHNLPGMVWSVLTVVLYASSLICLGQWIAAPLGKPIGMLGWSVSFVAGIAVTSLVISVLAMIGVAYPVFIVTLAIVPLILSLSSKKTGNSDQSKGEVSTLRPVWNIWTLGAAVGILLGITYAFVLSLAWPRWGDQCIYHLVIPRSIVWNHQLIFNPFSHDAGMFYGWQIAALPAYILGGERAFFLLSFVSLILLAGMIFEITAAQYSADWGVAAAAVVIMVIVGLCRETLVNNDVPMVLVECVLLWVVFKAPTNTITHHCIGLLGGFLVVIKLVSLEILPLIYGYYAWRQRKNLLMALVGMAAGTLLMVLPWAIHNFIASGTILPHFMLFWSPRWGSLPQMTDSMLYHMHYSGIWYEKNYHLFFSHGMELFTILLFCFIFVLVKSAARREKLMLFLLAYSIARFIGLYALSDFQSSVLFHNRYNLISYLFLGLAALIVVYVTVRDVMLPRWHPILIVLLLAAWTRWFFAPLTVLDPEGEGGSYQIRHGASLAEGMMNAWKTWGEEPGGGKSGIGFDWAAKHLPTNALVATTAIDPYLMGHRFLQILPVSETKIDLSLPPELLLQSLRAQGATHLHLTEFSGLNLWMNPIIDKWLSSLRQVGSMPEVRQLISFEYRDGKGKQSFYELTPSPIISSVPQPDLEQVKLRQDPDNTWIVSWKPFQGGRIRINLIQSFGQLELLGIAASEIGEFPIRMNLNSSFKLEAQCVSEGKKTQVVTIKYPDHS